MTKVLVTGASGLLATNTIISLLENEYAVIAMVRNKAKFLFPDLANIEVKEGDITNFKSIEDCLQGCDCIIHAAAETNQGLSNYNDYLRINVNGTNNVFKAALKFKIKKVIYVSTSNVFGFGSLSIPGNESFKIKKPFSDSLYVKSKIEAQAIALSYSHQTEVIVVNPTFLIGAFEQKPSSGKMVLMGLNKRLIFYPPGGKNFINVKDAALAIIKILTIGKNKESYILANENISYKEFFKKVSVFNDKKTMFIKIPKFVLMSLGVIGNLLQYFGMNTAFSLTNMKILCTSNYYSGDKAKNLLKLNYNPIDLGILEAVNWFNRKNHRIKKLSARNRDM